MEIHWPGRRRGDRAHDLLVEFLVMDIQRSLASARDLAARIEAVQSRELPTWERVGNAYHLQLSADGAVIKDLVAEGRASVSVPLEELAAAVSGWIEELDPPSAPESPQAPTLAEAQYALKAIVASLEAINEELATITAVLPSPADDAEWPATAFLRCIVECIQAELLEDALSSLRDVAEKDAEGLSLEWAEWAGSREPEDE